MKKALAKHGEVFHSDNITDALYLMAERDFDYYFIDADIRDSRAFIHHIRHDPQLAPPCGIVLLTGNMDEDCEAWRVDTFITRERFSQDVPYVFSHLTGRDDEPENVVRIAPAADTERPALPAGRPGRAERLFEEASPPGGKDARDGASAEPRSVAEGVGGRVPDRTDYTGGSMGRGGLKVAVIVVLAGALVVWMVTLGPFGKRSDREASEKAKSRSVEAGSYGERGSAPGEGRGSVAPYSTSPAPVAQPPAAAAPATPVVESGAVETSRETPPAHEPPAASANNAPSASISGPDQLMRGESGTYSASGSDPDGDSVTLSWTSRTLCWSVPGQYSVSVTVSDSRGATSSAVKSIRVI